MSYNFFLGVDPGGKGAIAVVDRHGELTTVIKVKTRPLWGHKIFDPKHLRDSVHQGIVGLWSSSICLFEQVNPYNQGRTSAFTFSANSLGVYLVLEAAGLKIQSATPQEWKRLMGVDSSNLSTQTGKTGLKTLSKSKAHKIFPDFRFNKSSSGDEEEAALLARLAWNTWGKK